MSIQPGDDIGNSSGHVAGEGLNATYTSIKAARAASCLFRVPSGCCRLPDRFRSPQKSRSSAVYTVRWAMCGLWCITMRKRRDYWAFSVDQKPFIGADDESRASEAGSLTCKGFRV